ncbi:hypothetical protein F5Y14DRAFT_273717 [Nemania sp. NC0429]|nr:hypothetical protein F5Y14DRAFT_273717 [Nemania sp. NC0429]
MELDAMILRCVQIRSLSPLSPIKYPFCQDTLESLQQYRRHVGRHQVDLALFALPTIGDEEEPDERNRGHETVSMHSDSSHSYQSVPSVGHKAGLSSEEDGDEEPDERNKDQGTTSIQNHTRSKESGFNVVTYSSKARPFL